MTKGFFFSFFLGTVSVAQAVLNQRRIAKFGLGGAVLANNAVLLMATVFLVSAVGSFKGVELRNTLTLQTFRLSDILPGLLGVILVAGIPFAVESFGSSRVFIPLIAAQIVSSLVADRFFAGQSQNIMTFHQFLGAGLVFVGAAFAAKGG